MENVIIGLRNSSREYKKTLRGTQNPTAIKVMQDRIDFNHGLMVDNEYVLREAQQIFTELDTQKAKPKIILPK
jgi:hypothetical protein